MLLNGLVIRGGVAGLGDVVLSGYTTAVAAAILTVDLSKLIFGLVPPAP